MKIRYVDISLPPLELKEFCERNDDWVLKLDDSMEPDELKSLFDKHINSPHCYDLIIESIAEHPNTPVEILEKLSIKQNWRILDSLATNPSINKKIIGEILKADNYTVLEHLAYNPAMGLNELKILFDSTDDEDLKEVVSNVLEKN